MSVSPCGAASRPLAPEGRAPLCIDLFCGLGGWTEGFLLQRLPGFEGCRDVAGELKGDLGYLRGDIPALMPFGKAIKVASESGRRTDPGKGARFTSRDCGIVGVKNPGYNAVSYRGKAWNDEAAKSLGYQWGGKHGSRSSARKAASAQIAKIPFELARHIAATFKPRQSLEQAARLAAAAGNNKTVG